MKKAAFLMGLLGWILFSSAIQAATYDATGKWNFSVYNHWNNCSEPVEPNETGTAVLIQTANSFVLVFTSSTAGTLKTVSGTINGATYQFSDRYWEDGGWTNDTTTLTLSSSTSGTGSASWRWSDGVNNCAGGYSLSISRQSQSPPLYKASGTWNFSESGIWSNCGEGNPSGDSGTMTIEQNGNRITGTDSKGGAWQGFVSGAAYTFVDSYAEDGGITSDVCTLNLSSASQGNGQCWWVWDKDGNSNDNCQGTLNISITKQAGMTSKPMPWIPLLLSDEAPGPAILSYIAISGLPQVNESSGAQYTCTAYYSDGSSQVVTNSTTWSENSGYATISSTGYLTTQAVSSDQSCNITAQFGGKFDTHGMTIKNIPPPQTTITITSLPTTDSDGNYTLAWSVSGLASIPWYIHEDSDTRFSSPTSYLSYDNNAPYAMDFSNKPNGTFCYRVGLSPSGPFSSPACVTVSTPQRQVTINNQITSGLNLQQVVQVKISATNNFSRSDLLTNDPARCLSLPGDAINRGGSRTFTITSGSNYYLFIGIGTWDTDFYFCSSNNPWFKRCYFTDPNTFYTSYVYTIVQVTEHDSGNWNWIITGSYLNGTLKVTPSSSNPIDFTVTQTNPIP